MVSPAGASTSRPSRVNLMGRLVSLMASPAVFLPASEGRLELLGKVFEHAQQRIWSRLAEAANRGVAHRRGKLSEERLVPRPRRHQHRSLLGADPAWRALAAALVLEELHQIERHRLH